MDWTVKLRIGDDCAWPRSMRVMRESTGETRNYMPERLCYPKREYLDNHSELCVTVCSACHVSLDDLEDCYYCPNCGARVVVDL